VGVFSGDQELIRHGPDTLGETVFNGLSRYGLDHDDAQVWMFRHITARPTLCAWAQAYRMSSRCYVSVASRVYASVCVPAGLSRSWPLLSTCIMVRVEPIHFNDTLTFTCVDFSCRCARLHVRL
jgi:hypothetical protein